MYTIEPGLQDSTASIQEPTACWDGEQTKSARAGGANVADLRRRLTAGYPALAALLERSALAVNDQFADDATTIPPGAMMSGRGTPVSVGPALEK